MMMTIRFGDAAQVQAYYEKLNGFSDKSKQRLLKVDDLQKAEKRGDAFKRKHEVVAGAYGAFDKNIRWLNKEIIRLVKGRSQAKKAGNEVEQKTFAEQLKDLRVAINKVLKPIRSAQ